MAAEGLPFGVDSDDSGVSQTPTQVSELGGGEVLERKAMREYVFCVVNPKPTTHASREKKN